MELHEKDMKQPVAAESVLSSNSEEAVAPVAEATATENEAAETPASEGEQNVRFTTKEELLEALAAIGNDADADPSRELLARFKQQFYALRKAEVDAEFKAFTEAGNQADAFVPALCPEEQTFKELFNKIRDRKAAQMAAREAELQENLEKKQALIAELGTLAADTDNVNRTFPRVKEIQAEFKAIGEVPAPAVTDLWKSYQQAVEQFYDQLKVNKDLRDYDFRKNLELKTLLCEEAEKLDAEDDVVLAFKRLQNLHDEWRQTGPVDKEVRQEIWLRFKDASAVINKKYQAFFEERKARETANEAAKTSLCERVEAMDLAALSSFNAWDAATKEVLAAQEEWKTIGFAARKVNNQLFNRFREACDKFFSAKAEYYRSVKEELNNNLAKKTRLCEEAEKLSDSTDWRTTADRLVAMQKEWKTIGAVPKKQSDAIWERFQKACDHFFEQRKASLSESRSAEQANLKAKREIIEQLKAIPADLPRNETMAKVKELQARWQEIGHVPFRDKDKIYDEYRALCDAFYANARDSRNSNAMSRFEDVVNEMSDDDTKLRRERERLNRALEIKRSEIKTYENNLGFLTSKSKQGASMVREMERRIQRLKDEAAAIEEKIKLVNSHLA